LYFDNGLKPPAYNILLLRDCTLKMV